MESPMLKNALLIGATLLFCLTDQGQEVLQWLDQRIDMELLVQRFAQWLNDAIMPR